MDVRAGCLDFRCGYRSMYIPILGCRINRVGIWIDLTRVLIALLNNFGSFIGLSYVLVGSVQIQLRCEILYRLFMRIFLLMDEVHYTIGSSGTSSC